VCLPELAESEAISPDLSRHLKGFLAVSTEEGCYFFNTLTALRAKLSKVGGVEIRYKMTMLSLGLENSPDGENAYKQRGARNIPKFGIFKALCGSFQTCSGRVFALASALF
jgi:hypothetical protein